MALVFPHRNTLPEGLKSDTRSNPGLANEETFSGRFYDF